MYAKAKTSYNDCTCVRSDNASPLSHLIPREYHVSNYVGFELHKVFTNASLV